MMVQSPLGQKISAPKGYSPELLFPIPRAKGREQIKASKQQFTEMHGYDVWTCWEVYWLNAEGEATSQVLQLVVPTESPYIVESKSLKLYLNGFNHERVGTSGQLLEIVKRDLQKLLGAEIECQWLSLAQLSRTLPQGKCLSLGKSNVDESTNCYWDNSFRSLCPVTGQPDFATIYVENFLGSSDWLINYWHSFANHQGYHEQCMEQIFINTQLKQDEPLRLGLAFVRRGGIDIHPIRFHVNFSEKAKQSSKPLEILRTPWQ